MKTRREFLEFMGYGLAASTALGQIAVLSGCSTSSKGSSSSGKIPNLPFQFQDELKTVAGLSYYHLLTSGDKINSRGEYFGSHPDFLSYLPLSAQNPLDGYLWVNHEYFEPPFISGFQRTQKLEEKTQAQIDLEKKEVGGSLVNIRKNLSSGKWELVANDQINRRYDGSTPIPFATGQNILGKSAEGTLGNCCGGLTPWGTFLTCEENFHQYYGDVRFSSDRKRTVTPSQHPMAWDRKAPRPPEHYGWVCEIDPKTKSIHKLPSLGRFAHEGATVTTAKDGRAVVYMGDDRDNECFYKFVSDSKNSLAKGTLYVAVFEDDTHQSGKGKGRWVPLDLRNPLLKNKFNSQTELLIRTREAARIVGGTPLDRPEDCEIDPSTNFIYLTCTNNKSAGRPHGQILKFIEADSNFLSEQFEWSVFIKGSSESGFSCPDNLAFDAQGNLWVLSDMPDDAISEHSKMGNNSLFYIPMSGPQKGEIFRLATGPKDSELTGLWFAPDGETAFLSVQHPGSSSKSEKPEDLTSNWPRGGKSLPLSSVVVLEGPLLRRLIQGSSRI